MRDATVEEGYIMPATTGKESGIVLTTAHPLLGMSMDAT
jgi:hypothetical protein